MKKLLIGLLALGNLSTAIAGCKYQYVDKAENRYYTNKTLLFSAVGLIAGGAIASNSTNSNGERKSLTSESTLGAGAAGALIGGTFRIPIMENSFNLDKAKNPYAKSARAIFAALDGKISKELERELALSSYNPFEIENIKINIIDFIQREIDWDGRLCKKNGKKKILKFKKMVELIKSEISIFEY